MKVSSHLYLDRIRNGSVLIRSPCAPESRWVVHKHGRCPLGWILGVGRQFGFKNLDGQLSDLVEQHRFDILRCKDFGLVEGFVVSITEEE